MSSGANQHMNAKYLLKVDIKNCYQSIRPHHVISSILENCKPSAQRTRAINLLPQCFINNGRTIYLPTGSPTSSILCNIALTPIDIRIEALTSLEGYVYTRYLDDIAISTTQNRRWTLIDDISNIISSYSLQINKKKTRWNTKNSDKMIVTGLSLSERKIPREMRQMLRARLHNLACSGQPFDKETEGYLAYVSSVDKTTLNWLIRGYQKSRIKYGQVK